MDEIWERLLRRSVRTPAGCLEWQGARAWNGYGFIKVAGMQRRVHRVAYELAVGPVPEGMLVCHTCDNPPCFDPRHLWLGTTKQNHADREAKGRGRRLKGVDNPDAKLTEMQVIQIRRRCALGDSQQHVAQQYGVSQSLVSGIVNRTKWSHLP